MTPLCTLLANYATTTVNHWNKRSAGNGEIADQKEEIFIEAGMYEMNYLVVIIFMR